MSRSRRFRSALVALRSPPSGGRGRPRPPESIGYAALGMTRKTIQRKLKNPIARSHDAQLCYLSYHYPAHDRIGNPGGR